MMTKRRGSKSKRNNNPFPKTMVMSNGRRVKRPSCLSPRYSHTECIRGRNGRRICRPVYTINEGCLRDNVTVNYSAGGNHGAYHWVPPNVLIVSRNLPKRERVAISHHELTEYAEMKYGHKSYGAAHYVANRDEAGYRARRNGGKKPSWF